MSGTINLAFSQQFDMDGAPLSGGLLNFFAAGTTTPQSAFQDTGLTIVHPNPIVLDASGRVPMFYLADGFIKIRLTDKNGVTVIAADQLLVIGPSTSTGGGGGGGTPSDPTQLMSTGDIKARYDTGVKDGFVRLNGQSIGNTGSSATERADPACQPLFVYLWPFSNITLDGFAKGANALADFGAGRRMFLPDLRGRTIAGMDDMGNPTPANRLTTTFFGSSGIVLGNAGGNQSRALIAGNLPPHTHAGQTGNNNADHTHGVSASGTTGAANSSLDHTHNQTTHQEIGGITGGGSAVNQAGLGTATGGANSSLDHTHNVSVSGSTGGASNAHQHSFTTDNGPGASAAFAVASPAMVMTFYMKM